MFEIQQACQNCSSFILMPKENNSLTLEEISDLLIDNAFQLKTFTGSMLSLHKKNKINIYNSGRIVIMTKDLNEVKELARELSDILYKK